MVQAKWNSAVIADSDAPIVVEGGFAILRCERKIKLATAPFEAVAQKIRRRLRLEQERSLMRQQAQVLLDGSGVTVLDPALSRAWLQRIGDVHPAAR